MSIIIHGVLSVKSIQGRNGAFSVGDLRTEIGEFRIKDALLDEYEQGQYTGRFVINSIFPHSYVHQGRVSIEVRAKLQEILLDEADVSAPLPVEVPERDPLDEDSSKPVAAPSPPLAVLESTVTSGDLAESAKPSTAGSADSPSLSIFDDEVQALIDAGVDMVKLDPTVDRNLFRRQRDALKALGYTFNPAAQSWTK
jgi:hypothetical protein